MHAAPARPHSPASVGKVRTCPLTRSPGGLDVRDPHAGDNGPKKTDLTATSNLIAAAQKHSAGSLRRFVLVTSTGVERFSQGPPYAILNLFGVLKYKRMSEQILQESGLPWTILRPTRLT